MRQEARVSDGSLVFLVNLAVAVEVLVDEVATLGYTEGVFEAAKLDLLVGVEEACAVEAQFGVDAAVDAVAEELADAEALAAQG